MAIGAAVSVAAKAASKAAKSVAKKAGSKAAEKFSTQKVRIIAAGVVVTLVIFLLATMNGVQEGLSSMKGADLCDSGLDGSVSSVSSGGSGEIGNGYVVHEDYKNVTYYTTVGDTYANVSPPLTSKVVYPYSGGAMTTTSTYGWRIHPVTGKKAFHAGQDIARTGDFNSIADGVVVKIYNPTNPAEAPFITIKHNINGKIYFSRYLHWSTTYVKVGDVVKAGQKIGVTGTRGPSTGVHLHLEIADGAEYNIIDPSTFLTQMGATTDYASNGDGGTVLVADAEEQCDDGDLGGSMSDGARAIILEAARSQIGVPYVWGGTTENQAFDCSGLSQYAYRKAGIQLLRVAQDQYNQSKKITKSQAQPGDLIFWGTPGAVYHVAIYIGGDKMIEAPKPGLKVRETTIWGSPLSFGTFDSLKGSSASGDPKTYAKSVVGSMWSNSSGEFACLDKLWTKESSWDYRATNPSSGAYGIPQSLPGSKMAAAGADWQTNPNTQINWGLNYIQGRYGSPCSAWAHSQATGWY